MEPQFKKIFLLLCAVAGIFLFSGLGLYDLSSGDETRVAGISAEMLLENDWIVPRLNGQPFLEYPPMYYWCVAGSFKLFGIHDFVAKLPSALAAFGSVILAFFFARKLKFSLYNAAASGVILLCCAQFFSESRCCRVDMLLAFLIQLSLFFFYSFTQEKSLRGRVGYWSLFALSLTATLYTKGLVGGAITASVIGPWLVLSDILEKRVSWKNYLAAFAGGLFALILTGIWYAAIYHAGGKAMFHTAFWVNNLGRFSGSQGDHREGLFYYLKKMPELFVPWQIVLFWGLGSCVRLVRKEKDRTMLYLLCAIVFPFLLLSIASAKRTVYLQCIALPCALLIGWQLFHLPESWIHFLRRKIPVSPAWAAGILLIVLFVGFSMADGFIAGKKCREESLRPLFDRCKELEKQGKVITLENPPERTSGAAYFYLHRRVPCKNGAVEKNECRIVRSRKIPEGIVEYGDFHFIREAR